LNSDPSNLNFQISPSLNENNKTTLQDRGEN
jgi:hypothetical protein